MCFSSCQWENRDGDCTNRGLKDENCHCYEDTENNDDDDDGNEDDDDDDDE